jgi:glycosyltransferase involved in cell wall biosynthesis
VTRRGGHRSAPPPDAGEGRVYDGAMQGSPSDAATPNGELRSLHSPVNFGGIPMVNVQALRRQGLDARLLLYRAPKWRSDPVDIVLRRPQNRVGRELVGAAALAKLLPSTDVFHFYFGHTLVPKPIQLPILRGLRKKAIFHYLGSDIRGKSREELAYGRRADAQIVGSYDAIRWVPEAEVVPPGIDVDRYPYSPPEEDIDRPVRVVHAPGGRARKGTDYVIEACERLPVELDIIENVPHDEAARRYAQADIIVDQLNAGWYGCFAIEAMALGKPVFTYLHDEARERTEEAFGTQIPIVSAGKHELAEKLAPLVESGALRRRVGAASRAYVEAVHHIDRVGRQLAAIYRRL